MEEVASNSDTFLVETTAMSWLQTEGNSSTSLAEEIIFYYKLFICICGLFGNVINIVVLQYTKIPLTTRITMSILALSDFILLLLSISNSIKYHSLIFQMLYVS